MPDRIAYKVLTGDELAQLERDGRFDGSAADAADGFIHLSTAAQLASTVERHYAGRTGLFVAAVDLSLCGDTVRWEPARDGQLFPHVYGALVGAAVLATAALERDARGEIVLPTHPSA